MSKKSRIQSKTNSGSKFSFNNILKVIIYLVVSRKAPNSAIIPDEARNEV